jgi:hypothetical protein
MSRSRRRKYKRSRSFIRGWKKSSPYGKPSRRILRNRCGSKCFLSPKNLKYPICGKSGKCKLSCAGLLAAYTRSRQWKHNNIVSKARRIAKRSNCSWIH